MVRLLRHRQTKGPATARPHLTHRATSRLHKLSRYPRPSLALTVVHLSIVWLVLWSEESGRTRSPKRSSTQNQYVEALQEVTNRSLGPGFVRKLDAPEVMRGIKRLDAQLVLPIFLRVADADHTEFLRLLRKAVPHLNA